MRVLSNLNVSWVLLQSSVCKLESFINSCSENETSWWEVDELLQKKGKGFSISTLGVYKKGNKKERKQIILGLKNLLAFYFEFDEFYFEKPAFWTKLIR